ncbi:uncharacterized protein EV422DRAFT_566897 [Fimicolochytrium jonesii]|uniref:uncharacterized protein n=1 Tax=Fimicolochytrium jonesii TaxID=1396493 RepID=UPI0022FE811E|nr:uncharacterized protein EV422DRAFT_566897 [Fimicolochytrium jonesii]KAI8821819.1 hypothetical protein EV422DRAFT_566897 [Fimicolochytrium jonesii]
MDNNSSPTFSFYGSADWQMLDQQLFPTGNYPGTPLNSEASQNWMPGGFEPVSPVSEDSAPSPSSSKFAELPLFSDLAGDIVPGGDNASYSTSFYTPLSPDGKYVPPIEEYQWTSDHRFTDNTLGLTLNASGMKIPDGSTLAPMLNQWALSLPPMVDGDSGLPQPSMPLGSNASAATTVSAVASAAQQLVDQHQVTQSMLQANANRPENVSASVDIPLPELQVIPPINMSKLTKAERKKIRENTRNLICFNCKTSRTPLWRRTADRQHPLCNACGLYYKQYQCHRPSNIRQKTSSSVELSIVSTANGTDYAVVMPSAAALRKDAGAMVKVVSINNTSGIHKPHQTYTTEAFAMQHAFAEAITARLDPSSTSATPMTTNPSLKRRRESIESNQDSTTSSSSPSPFDPFTIASSPEVDLGMFQHRVKRMCQLDAVRLLGSMESQIALLRNHIATCSREDARAVQQLA